nr:MAG TPA: major capsid protein [Caudoviricetes sp.]
MALKALMLRRSIENKKAELAKFTAKDAEMQTREADLEKSVAEVETEEQQNAVSAEIDQFEADRAAHEKSKADLLESISALERELEELERSDPALQKKEEPKSERGMNMVNFDVRSLPIGKAVVDALPTEQREIMMQREDVKKFLSELRAYKGQTRAITGGSLTIPTVLLDLVAENMYRYSKLINRVRVRNVAGVARQVVAGVIPEAVWTEMCGAINELSLEFNSYSLDGYKVAGYVPVCNALLEDNDIALASYIVEALAQAIGLALDKAILYGKGSGSKMPMGIVTRLAQQTKPSDYPSDAPAWTDLHTTNIQSIDASKTGADFWSALALAAGNTYTKYSRGIQFWAMNSKTYAKLKSKTITFTAQGDIVSNVFGVLPIVNGDIDILEFMPDGDIVGGYGDLYLLAQRAGMEIESDRSVQFIQDNTVFRGKQRADGVPIVPGAFVAINIDGATVTTAMDFAGDTANDATLSSLTVGTETLTPTFAAGTTSYAITASGTSAAVTATPAQADAVVAIAYNGKNISNGASVTWTSGAHPLTITVKRGNSTRVYTVTVTKS